MRRLLALLACLLAVLLPAAGASAHGFSFLATTHGPDPRSIDRGPEVPAPSGGPRGHALRRGVLAHSAAVGRAVAAALPTTWCGDLGSDDDRTDEVDNGGPRYHAIYAIPADGVDRLRTVASALQADAFQASSLLERLYRRAIRFDIGTRCGPQFLDVSVVRMPQTAAQLRQLAGTDTRTIDAVTQALRAAGFDATQEADSLDLSARRSRNFLVWLDGPGPPAACGQGSLYDDSVRDPSNANNGGGAVALVFRDGSGFCGSNTVRHEIGHNLGALQPVAPHAFDGAHCDDAYEDTMCYSNAPVRATGAFQQLYFDYGNDDYFDPPAGPPLRWWTVDLSRFLCPDAACNVPPARPGDADGDGVLDAVDDCPAVANPGQEDTYGDARGDACEPRLEVRAERRGARWQVSIRVRGQGRAVVALTCRRRSRPLTVFRREIALPATLLVRVACPMRPEASVGQRPS